MLALLPVETLVVDNKEFASNKPGEGQTTTPIKKWKNAALSPSRESGHSISFDRAASVGPKGVATEVYAQELSTHPTSNRPR